MLPPPVRLIARRYVRRSRPTATPPRDATRSLTTDERRSDAAISVSRAGATAEDEGPGCRLLLPAIAIGILMHGKRGWPGQAMTTSSGRYRPRGSRNMKDRVAVSAVACPRSAITCRPSYVLRRRALVNPALNRGA